VSRKLRRYWLVSLLLVLVVVSGAYLARHRRGVTALRSLEPDISSLCEAVGDANLVICVIDAARADHVGCYGYPRDTTPNIDRLAEHSLLFEQHFSNYTSTKPSTASLFTSQYPDTHLVNNERPVLESAFTMAQGLETAGFRTVLFSSNVKACPEVGIGCHFGEAYSRSELEGFTEQGERWQAPEPLLRAFDDWLGERRDSRFYAYLHFLPPHIPYKQPKVMTALFKGQEPPAYRPEDYHPGEDYPFPIKEREFYANPPLPDWINVYDANLRYGDWAVGEVERLLKKAGALENTLLIVTSDHGEAFGEHGYVYHGDPIHDEVTHIPLLIKFPGEGTRPRRFGALTETVDLLPTICDLFEVPYPGEEVQGRSLAPLMAGVADRVNDHAFTRAPDDYGRYMVRNLRYSLLLYGNGEWRALYDLEADPGQNHDVMDQQPRPTEELLEAFRAFAETQRRPPVNFLNPEAEEPLTPDDVQKTKLTPELQKELRALGYLR
jgi:arylsulfatase A-like enzyme